MFVTRRDVKAFKINNTYTNRLGGFTPYWKLFFQAWEMAKNHPVGAWKIRRTLVWRSPWFLLIKPLGCLFSFKINYIGTYQIVDNSEIQNCAVTKTWIVKFLGIPVVYYVTNKLTSKDWKKLGCNLNERKGGSHE